MKSRLTTYAALAALALAAGAPSIASAADVVGALLTAEPAATAAAPVQDRGRREGGRRARGGEGGESSARAQGSDASGWNRSGARRESGGETRRARPSAPATVQPSQPQTPAPPQARGGRNRGEGAGARQDRNRGGQGQRPGQGQDWRGGQTPGQGGARGGPGRDGRGQDWNRGGDNRGRDNGGWNGQDRNRGNDGRDRNGGSWNGGRDRNNGGWDRNRNGGGRNWQSDRNGRRDYDGFRNRWNQNDWRRSWSRGHSRDWWRNDRGFRGYTGFRIGYYFAPNYGYYAVPRNYFGQRWSTGDYLPSIFWRYSLNDYRTYGLGYPPPGTQWVAVDNTIYLIDSLDGYIIEVIYDAWSW